ncbi:MAG TPA: nucleic-acid-binding protein, contains PIN domain protein [Planctomycetes bacterium]|jgi:predicted nucleic acid-binding protein|nr:nucleic-acid-binding protein, contains PIN domain protein [Planctomycetota bacterium]
MTGIDTNVLVYACDKRDPVKQAKAQELIEKTGDGVLLWQVACEFLAASRKLDAQGFTPCEAWARLSELLALFPLLLPVAGVLTRSRDLQLEKKMSFWDALIVGACLESGADRLYSEDLPGGNIDGLEVINPFH